MRQQMRQTLVSIRLWRWAALGLVLIALSALFRASPAQAQQWDRGAVKRALQATVLVLVTDDQGDLNDSGSGTVLDAERGLILTNYHVMGDTDTRELYNQDGLAFIAINPTDLKGAPVIRYAAQMIAGSPELDLAVLRVTGMASDAKAALPKNLGLISVDRGNSDDLLPGDPLAVIGFPGLGGSTVTFTDGVVSGFLDEDEDGNNDWIKTDTEVNPGNSGGLAIDQRGDFIGVPTAGYSQADVAGKISLIRPGNTALGYFDRAALGQAEGQVTGSTAGSNTGKTGGKTGVTAGTATTGAAAPGRFFGPITFAAGVDDNDEPVDTGNTFLDVGAVYAFFSVTGMRQGATWQTRWLLDGQEVLKEDQTWEGGDADSTWVSISHPDGMPVGVFTLELYTNGRLDQSASFTVADQAGGQANSAEPVNVTGVVHDMDNTRKTIPGALVVFLNPGVTIQEWVDAEFDESMVFASGTSARGGKFSLDAKVTPGTAYSIVAVHDDYAPFQADGYEIPADADDPFALELPLRRQ